MELNDDIGYGEPDAEQPESTRMSEQELLALVDTEVSEARSYQDTVGALRREALEFYFGDPVGRLAPPEIEGRSTVVSTDVQDTIEWMLPSLLKIFTAGDEVVEFTPNGPEDEAGAKQATEYINYLFRNHPDTFRLLYTWLKDGLLEKLGVAMVYWDPTPNREREQYSGLSDLQLQQLLNDPDVEPIEHAVRTELRLVMTPQGQTQQQDQSHDVTILRTTKRGKICFESVPQDEFLLSPAARSLEDDNLPFIGRRYRKTISQLEEMGVSDAEDITSDTAEEGWLNTARYRYNDSTWELDLYEPADPAMRMVWLTDAYIRLDYDGDGIAELRHIIRSGTRVLLNEEVDDHPFSAFCPVPITHRVIGLSVADQAMESQRIKTAVQRAVLDNFYLSVNKRIGAVVDQVNLDDLLDSKPGGIVRIKRPDALVPIEQSGIGADAMGLLEYLEVQKENRTGFTRYSQGLQADSLNQTATGMNIITNRSDQRVELIARLFAEAMKTLFKKTLALVIQHQDRKAVYRLRNQWVEVDPSEWRTNYDMSVTVGLGTGNKDQQVQHMMMLLQTQQQLLQLGVATPQNIFAAASRLTQALGYKNSEQYFTEPNPNGPLQQMQQQMQQMDQHAKEAVAALQQQIAQLKADKEVDLRKVDVSAYGEETKRMAALAPALTPDQLMPLIQQMVMQVLSSPDVLPLPPQMQPMPQQPMNGPNMAPPTEPGMMQ